MSRINQNQYGQIAFSNFHDVFSFYNSQIITKRELLLTHKNLEPKTKGYFYEMKSGTEEMYLVTLLYQDTCSVVLIVGFMER